MSLAIKLYERIQQKRDRIYKQIQDVAESSGLKVSDEIQKERFDICLACPKLYHPTRSCKLCGCFMQVKTYFATQECPIGKWGAVEVNKDNKVEK